MSNELPPLKLPALPSLPSRSFADHERYIIELREVMRCRERLLEAREHALLSRIAQLEHMWREAEDRALCAEEAAMSHAARIIELEKKYEQAPS